MSVAATAAPVVAPHAGGAAPSPATPPGRFDRLFLEKMAVVVAACMQVRWGFLEFLRGVVGARPDSTSSGCMHAWHRGASCCWLASGGFACVPTTHVGASLEISIPFTPSMQLVYLARQWHVSTPWENVQAAATVIYCLIILAITQHHEFYKRHR